MREADHSPPSSAEVKNTWKYTSIPPIRLHDAVVSERNAETTLPLILQGQIYLFSFTLPLFGTLGAVTAQSV
jgi:hypothetical protein